MLLILLLAGLVLIITIFAIALIWDYTHGIFSLSRNADTATLDSTSNDSECNGAPQPIESPTA